MSALLADLRRAARGEVLEQAPLASRTSVRVGGAAQLWVKPRDPDALLLELLRLGPAPDLATRARQHRPAGQLAVPVAQA